MAEPQPPLRPLPAKKNTLMLRAATPPCNLTSPIPSRVTKVHINNPTDEELVSIRRLGQTHIPTPSNTPPIYSHLPAPLPSDIFSDFHSATTHYYLLRRLSDNYVSATCLFGAVFPYANADEKIREFRYSRSIFKAQYDELTGDVWISGKQAMKLAEDYGVRRWVGALLDPREVEAIPHEIIDLTLDDSDEEVEIEDEQPEGDSEEDERREDEARERRQREEDKRKEREAIEAREEERMRELERGVEARERRKEREQCHEQTMQIAAVM